ncbi:MAG: ShlB/FhaC/HecB family hemolysin secretion/activation protein [Burkholderiaceae bacterium]|jgi:hemolysin activation/secretion protein
MTAPPLLIHALRAPGRRTRTRAREQSCARIGLVKLAALAVLGLVPLFGGAQSGPMPQPQEISFTVTRFEVTGENPLSASTTDETLKPYLGVQHGLAGLESARRALDSALRNAGYSLYRVTLPPQTTVNVIRLVVTRILLTGLETTGQKYFSSANILAGVPALAVGQSPDMREVARQLEIVNDNPDKHVTLGLKESDSGDGIVGTLETSDRNPLSFTAGYNNTGLDDQGGRSRIAGYLQYGNLFDLDQSIGVAYTTSPNDPSQVKQYGVYYRAPIYSWGGVVTASHSYSSVSTGALGGGTVITGAGTTTGLAYTEYLYPVGNYKSSISLGVDDKLYESPVIDGISVPGGDVRSRPVSLTYVATYQPNWGSLTYNVEYDKNLGSGASDTDAAYAANRAGATRDWDALRLYSSFSMPLVGGWSTAAILHGQYATQPLIAGEQFALGGAQSIRGAEERAVTGDSGASVSLEIYTPELAENLRLLAFSDNGYLIRHDVQPGETGHETLESVGLGLRWSYQRSAQLALDYGYITKGARYPSVPAGTSRVHVNLTYTY